MAVIVKIDIKDDRKKGRESEMYHSSLSHHPTTSSGRSRSTFWTLESRHLNSILLL